MSTHKKVMLKKVVGGSNWKARCLCGENFRGATKKEVEDGLKSHLSSATGTTQVEETESTEEVESVRDTSEE